MLQNRPRLAAVLCALSLSACTTATDLTAKPAATTSTPASTPGGSSQTVPTPDLRLRLQADAALQAFTTQQNTAFSLCLSRIAHVSVRLSVSPGAIWGTTLNLERELNLKALLAGVELRFADVPASPGEGRTTFYDSSGHELGFVTWQLPSDSRAVTIALRPDGEVQSAETCPRLIAELSGGTLTGTGGQLSASPAASPSPLSPAGQTPSPAPAASTAPAGNAPAAPLNVKVVEQTISSLTLQWEFPADARSFNLYLDGQQVATDHVTPNYYRFEGLSASTTYRLGVQSVNDSGASEIVTLTTATTSTGHSGSGNFSGGGSSKPRLSPSPKPYGPLIVDSGVVPNVTVLPDIDINASGATVMAWIRNDGVNGQVFAQRFTPTGKPDGEPVQVSLDTHDIETPPQVGLDEAGDFVVAWSTLAGSGDHDVFYRYFPAKGEPGEPVRAHSDTAGEQTDVGLDMQKDSGDFAVTWISTDDLDVETLLLQRFASNGDTVGEQITVNSEAYDFEFTNGFVSLDHDAEGNLAVAWSGQRDSDSNQEIFVRRITATGEMPASEFQVNVFTDNNQIDPSLAIDGDGDFVVTWTSYGQDGDNSGIYARHFDSADIAGEEFQVNLESAGGQGASFAAMHDDGRYVISWTSGFGIPVHVYYRTFSPEDRGGDEIQIDKEEAVSIIPKCAANANQVAFAWFMLDPVTNPVTPEFRVYTRRL